MKSQRERRKEKKEKSGIHMYSSFSFTTKVSIGPAAQGSTLVGASLSIVRQRA